MGKYKMRLFFLVLLVSIALLLRLLLPGSQHLIAQYDNYIYYPFQSIRGVIFGCVPFSAGDVIYIAGGVWLLATLVKWVRYITKFNFYKEQWVWSVIRSINTVLFFYVFFVLGWGANYYKPPLRESWNLQRDTSRTARREAVIAFNTFLINKLNYYAPLYAGRSLYDISHLAHEYYIHYTDSKVKRHGIGVKSSLFGFYMERMDVEGYYNPFTGEGQVNSGLPAFLLPFNVCHEIAHQTGIAAEGDANLVAYSICTMTNDPSFQYSAYLNLWLYTNNRLYGFDTAMAHQFTHQLNKLTLAHLDTLEQINERYHGGMSVVSMEVYDSYLKMQDQHDGLKSYGSVSANAWKLEQQRVAKRVDSVLHIP